MTKYYSVLSILVLLISIAAPGSLSAAEAIRVEVKGDDGAPVYGATVIALANGTIVDAAPTDSLGWARLKIDGDTKALITVRVSAIGFKTAEIAGVSDIADSPMTVLLESEAVEIGSVRVRSESRSLQSQEKKQRTEITTHARASLIGTNPVSAVKQPEVVREGSSHSSKLRIHGTSPQYSVNGISIGNNPNHFGIFSFIPASVMDGMTIQMQGTDASHGPPAVVEFETSKAFEQDFRAEGSASVMEATGVWSVGGKRWFLMGALRKSVLDKIVNEFDVSSERKTIPPTNFQDVFASGGFRLSPGLSLMVDHYSVRDYLSYKTEGTSNNPLGTNTALAGNERYTGARLELLLPDALLTFRGALRDGEAIYGASPVWETKAIDPIVNIRANERTWLMSGEAKVLFGQWELSSGIRGDFNTLRDMKMQQQHWNFLPPDANSDVPFIYQPELNEIYDRVQFLRNWSEYAGWFSAMREFGPVTAESGFRMHYFGGLRDEAVPTVRQTVMLRTGDNSRVRLFYGTFAESPVTKILEPYQALVRVDMQRLSPVTTQLLSGEISIGGLKLGAFHKRIENLPVLTPNFTEANPAAGVSADFLHMEPGAGLTLAGGSVSYELHDLLDRKLDLYGYYGYTEASRTIEGVTGAYEYNAPHRVFARGDYRLSSVVTLGGEIAVRSGYVYTPNDAYADLPADQRYTEDYYRSALRRENSARFPMHAGLNLNVNFDLGATDLYFAVSNVTNRGNPIVSTTDGAVYDAGILPSIGVTTRF